MDIPTDAYTTTYQLTQIKLKRNANMVNLLNLESKIAKLEMIISYRRVIHNTQYADMLDKINEIERKQLYDYSIDRENKVKLLTDKVNEMNSNIEDIKQEIVPLKHKFLETITAINSLNSSIPDKVYVCNKKEDPLQEHQKKCIPIRYR